VEQAFQPVVPFCKTVAAEISAEERKWQAGKPVPRSQIQTV